MSFRQHLREQRWDDHRYYHRSRINQSLHLLSALSFLCSYCMLLFQPVAAALVGWIVAMLSRQIGHFFFEPKDYDAINEVSHQHKEDIKIGYNLRRKVVLLSIWAISPLLLYLHPSFFGFFEPALNRSEFVDQVAALWLSLAGGALIFRTVHLFFIRDITTGVVWLAKILTDPFNDVRMYYRSPFYIAKGELLDPIK